MHESTEKKQVGNKDRTQITQITQFFVLYKPIGGLKEIA